MTNKEKKNIEKRSKTRGFTVTESVCVCVCVWRMDAFKPFGKEESSKIFLASKGNFANCEERITTK